MTSKSRYERLLTPKSHPIPLLADSNAQLYSHLHAPLVLSYYLLRFRVLVSDPLGTMVYDLLPVALVQCAFCALCIPSAGTWGAGGEAIISGTASATPKKTGTPIGSMRKKGKAMSGLGSAAGSQAGPPWKSRVMPVILALALCLTLPILPLALIAFVMGAPLYPTSLIPPTFLLATHVSLLATMPIFYAHGVHSPTWREIIAAWLPFDRAGVWGGSVGCVVGAWFGAIPMALDWDRDWQAWPVPPLTGAYLGWTLGRIVTGSLGLGVGKRIDLSVPVEEDDETDEKLGVEDKKKRS